MRYELLGSLRVTSDRGIHSLSAPKMEMTLATLLVGANRVITKEQLIMELWGDRPPRRATAAVHVYISQLRRFLGTADDLGEQAVVTKPAGYLLRLDGAEYDVNEFQRAMRCGRAHQSEGRHAQAVEAFEQAQALLRGPVLESLAEGPLLSSFAAWVEEERLACLELTVEARTALGQHREVISLLSSLTATYPLRESFYRQLMLVLYRSERQAEALQVYRSAQHILRAELGLEPCRSLRKLHRAILTSDRLLDLPVAG